MLRLTLSTEEYLMLGDDIKIVFLGGHGQSSEDNGGCSERGGYRAEHGARETSSGTEEPCCSVLCRAGASGEVPFEKGNEAAPRPGLNHDNNWEGEALAAGPAMSKSFFQIL